MTVRNGWTVGGRKDELSVKTGTCLIEWKRREFISLHFCSLFQSLVIKVNDWTRDEWNVVERNQEEGNKLKILCLPNGLFHIKK